MPPIQLEHILDRILQREGGFANDPDDPGGATNMGITRKTLADWRGTPVSIQDVEDLKSTEARAIYRARYIDAPAFDKLPVLLLPVLADSSVHHGPRQATLFLQHVLNRLDTGALHEDGVAGRRTQQMTDRVLQRTGLALPRSIIEERRRFFYRITAQKPVLGKFLNGWLARLNDLDLEYRDIN